MTIFPPLLYTALRKTSIGNTEMKAAQNNGGTKTKGGNTLNFFPVALLHKFAFAHFFQSFLTLFVS